MSAAALPRTPLPQDRPDVGLLQALRRSALTHRWARATARRTEILFSTLNGRFCLHADPSNTADSDWFYGVLYVFDGVGGAVRPAWQVIRGFPAMKMFDDQVWVGSAEEMAADAIDASRSHRFVLPASNRPMPPRTLSP